MIFAPGCGTRHDSRIEMGSFGIGVGALVVSALASSISTRSGQRAKSAWKARPDPAERARAFAVAAARRIGVGGWRRCWAPFVHRGVEVGRG